MLHGQKTIKICKHYYNGKWLTKYSINHWTKHNAKLINRISSKEK